MSPELIFDEGLGQLFVVRSAGNVIGSTLLGSIEYSVMHSTSRLIVVMGHEFCNVVEAAIYSFENYKKDKKKQQPKKNKTKTYEKQ